MICLHKLSATLVNGLNSSVTKNKSQPSARRRPHSLDKSIFYAINDDCHGVAQTKSQFIRTRPELQRPHGATMIRLNNNPSVVQTVTSSQKVPTDASEPMHDDLIGASGLNWLFCHEARPSSCHGVWQIIWRNCHETWWFNWRFRHKAQPHSCNDVWQINWRFWHGA